MQSETKLDGSLKTLVQTKSRYQQTQRFKSSVCKSWKRGQNIPSEDKKCPLKEIAKAENKDQ